MPRVKHYFETGQFAHITTRTEGAKFLLATDAAKTVILGSIHTYECKDFYRLLAYVIMDNHFHFVAVVRKSEGFGAAIGRLKGWTSREIEKMTGAPKPVWERRFDDNALLTEEELYAVVDYIHNNPVRAGIVKQAIDYPWSSARKWAEEGPSRL